MSHMKWDFYLVLISLNPLDWQLIYQFREPNLSEQVRHRQVKNSKETTSTDI